MSRHRVQSRSGRNVYCIVYGVPIVVIRAKAQSFQGHICSVNFLAYPFRKEYGNQRRFSCFGGCMPDAARARHTCAWTSRCLGSLVGADSNLNAHCNPRSTQACICSWQHCRSGESLRLAQGWRFREAEPYHTLQSRYRGAAKSEGCTLQ